QRFPTEWMPISQMSGVHISIAELPRVMPLRTAKDYEDFLARLAAYPRVVDQNVELMRRGMATGWVPPAVAIREGPPQIENLWLEDVTKTPLYQPFEVFPDATAAAERPRRAAQARETITDSIIPALKKLHRFIVGTYLPACRQEIAA